MNTRRKLIVALGAGALAAPFGSFAQQQGKVWRVGFLSPRSRPASFDPDAFGAFSNGMRELGYVEGKNLVIEWRFADGNYERLPGLAAEVVKMKVDVIVVQGTPAVSAAQKATMTIPIVFGSATDPVGSGFVKSLARPGGNITGLSNVSVEISPKLLEMLLTMVPRLSRVAVLVNPTNSSQAVAAAPAAFRVRAWHLMSRGWVPRTGQPLAEGASVGYPPGQAAQQAATADDGSQTAAGGESTFRKGGAGSLALADHVV